MTTLTSTPNEREKDENFEPKNIQLVDYLTPETSAFLITMKIHTLYDALMNDPDIISLTEFLEFSEWNLDFASSRTEELRLLVQKFSSQIEAYIQNHKP